MSLNLKLFHLKQAGEIQKPLLPRGYWHFATCLRSIVISEDFGLPDVLEDYEFYQGRQAYGFLLEVVCGLHSPMIGETEIFGQFKDFVCKNKNEFNSEMNHIVSHLLQEAKKIRNDFLQNLGCTSYGSLLRKHLRSGNRDIHMIGAGSLSQDILPWFYKIKQGHLRLHKKY